MVLKYIIVEDMLLTKIEIIFFFNFEMSRRIKCDCCEERE